MVADTLLVAYTHSLPFERWQTAFNSIPWDVAGDIDSGLLRRLHRDARDDICVEYSRGAHEDWYWHARLGSLIGEYAHAPVADRKALLAMGLVMADRHGNELRLPVAIGEQIVHALVYGGLVTIDAAQYAENAIDGNYLGELTPIKQRIDSIKQDMGDIESSPAPASLKVMGRETYTKRLRESGLLMQGLLQDRDTNKVIGIGVAEQLAKENKE